MSRLVANVIGEFLRPFNQFRARNHDDLLVIADTINNIRNMSNTVNVSGGGATLWQGTVLENETIYIANGLEYATGSIIVKRLTDDVFASSNFSIQDNNSPWSTNGVGVGIGLTGDMYIIGGAGHNFEVTVSFTSYPLMGGGLVGPIGPQGATGQPGADGEIVKTAWQNVSFAANWSDFGNNYRGGQYRLFDDVVQFRGLITCSGAWSSNQTMLTLPAGYRPTYRIMMMTNVNNGPIVGRVDILSTGELQLISYSGGTTGFVSLSNLQFPIN